MNSEIIKLNAMYKQIMIAEKCLIILCAYTNCNRMLVFILVKKLQVYVNKYNNNNNNLFTHFFK